MTEARDSITLQALSRRDLDAAAERLSGVVERTPVLTSRSISAIAGATLHFKCENFQTTGAFKFRGAMNALLTLTPERASRGVATHSSGNHAAALARAAAAVGTKAWVVMPSNANAAKKRAVAGYGAELIECGPTQSDREARFEQVVRAHAAEPVPPFDDVRVIAGQSTAARELLEQVPDLDAVVAPVGGGGLLAGTCLSVRHLAPRVRVYGAEPAAADDTQRSLRAGRRLPLSQPPETVADGLRTSVGELTFPIIRDGVSDILCASEDAIVAAMRSIWVRMKIVIEPSAAVPLAALLENPDVLAKQRVGVIVSGGNVDLSRLPWR